MPAKRRIALRSQRRPKRSNSAPTNSFNACCGTTLTSVTPSAATITASVSAAASVPMSGARHPRVTPTASTIVAASTHSTALAMNDGVAAWTSVARSTARDVGTFARVTDRRWNAAHPDRRQTDPLTAFVLPQPTHLLRLAQEVLEPSLRIHATLLEHDDSVRPAQRRTAV